MAGINISEEKNNWTEIFKKKLRRMLSKTMWESIKRLRR